MMTRAYVTAIFALMSVSQAYGAISVTPFNINTTTNANSARNALLGPGITTIGNATGVGSSVSAGTFTGGLSAGIGINNGIVLTTGNAGLIDSTNSSDSSSGIASFSGDASLNALGGGATLDTTSLTFSFEFAGGVGGNLFFNYVFASEEYNEYANTQFNDVFAFFLDGVNVALIPTTSTPVSINTVNGGNPLGTGPQNPQFYNNNDPSDGGIFPFEYDGFTDVFSVAALGLSPGTHTIKLAISDRGDRNYDSAVFIQAGTFSNAPTPPSGAVPEASQLLIWVGLALCGYSGRRAIATMLRA
jgi:hypothetical protein